MSRRQGSPVVRCLLLCRPPVVSPVTSSGCGFVGGISTRSDLVRGGGFYDPPAEIALHHARPAIVSHTQD